MTPTKFIPIFILIRPITLATVFVCAGSCSWGQAGPTEACAIPDAGFAWSSTKKVEIGEVAKRSAVQLEACGSPRGCVQAQVEWKAPVLVFRRQGEWTCGYVSERDGAGPAWIRSDALRDISYDENPATSAWVGTWTGGEDRVQIRPGSEPGTLSLLGNAKWTGTSTDHFGDTKGRAQPIGNHMHFVENGPGSCTIDLTLLNTYLLASDNGACGALNVRFQGIWKRANP